MDDLLNKRNIPAHSSNLSARIIAAAAIKNDVPLWQIILQEISSMFYIPKPAYAIAFCLVLGIFVGLQSDIDQTSTTAIDWFSFMSDTDLDWGVGV